jgi:hypothetical protein
VSGSGIVFSLVIQGMHPGATYTVSWDTPGAPLAGPNTPWGTCTGTLNSGGNQIAECLSPATSTPGWHQVLVLDGQGGEEHTAFWVRS